MIYSVPLTSLLAQLPGATPGLSSTGALLSNPILKGALVLLLIVIFVYFTFKVLKTAVQIVLNSLLGLALLVVLHFIPAVQAPITLISTLLVLFGGLLGVAAVVILKLLGIGL